MATFPTPREAMRQELIRQARSVTPGSPQDLARLQAMWNSIHASHRPVVSKEASK